EEREVAVRQLVGDEAVLVHRDADDLGAEAGEDLGGPVVRRRFDGHSRAGLDELLGKEDDALRRAARDHDARGLDTVPLGEPLAQRSVAPSGAVAEDRPAVALERRARAFSELLDGKALGSGDSAGERDHCSERNRASGRAEHYFIRSATICATSVGVVPTAIPRASSASFLPCAVPAEPEMIAPAWPIVLPGGAEKPAMYESTGFVTCSPMYAAAFSSSSPPISPTMTISSVCGSVSNFASTSMNEEPTTGSPPMPTIVELPSPSCVSSWPIWYVSVPERD